MPAAEVSARLAAYRARIEELLGLLEDGRAPEAEAIARADAACRAAFDEVRAGLVSCAGEDSSEDLARELVETERLNVLAVALVARHRDELLAERDVIRRARAVLENQGGDRRGRSCDVRG